MSEKSCVNPRMNRVGGQAVLEGVMMKSGNNVALSVRKEDGTIATEKSEHISVIKKHKCLNIPVLRGVINMVETFKLSYGTLGRSAEMLGIDDFEEETKFDKWLREKFGDKLMSVIMTIAAVLGVALAVLLFSFLPTFVVRLINDHVIELGWFKNLIQGLIKIVIFVSYLLLVSLMPDIKRTFEYHGAEHKSIACFESGEELTPENAIRHTRLHPRCGTSFLFVTMILSILVFSLIPWDFSDALPKIVNTLIRVGCQFIFLPVVVGLSFEFIMYAGKHHNVVTVVLSAPGLAMQKITTREPSLEQLEVAIASLKAAMPDEFPVETDDESADGTDDASDGAADESSDAKSSDGTENPVSSETADSTDETSDAE